MMVIGEAWNMISLGKKLRDRMFLDSFTLNACYAIL